MERRNTRHHTGYKKNVVWMKCSTSLMDQSLLQWIISKNFWERGKAIYDTKALKNDKTWMICEKELGNVRGGDQ